MGRMAGANAASRRNLSIDKFPLCNGCAVEYQKRHTVENFYPW